MGVETNCDGIAGNCARCDHDLRMLEGIEEKRLHGNWEEYGRKRVMSAKDFAKHYQKVINGELGSLELMRELKMKKATYYRYVNEYKANHQ